MTPHAPETNDPVERWLREDAARTVLDDGFSDQVMGALPARATFGGMGWKALLIFGSTALGVLLALCLGPTAAALVQGFADLLSARILTPSAVSVLALGVTTLIAGALLASDD